MLGPSLLRHAHLYVNEGSYLGARYMSKKYRFRLWLDTVAIYSCITQRFISTNFCDYLVVTDGKTITINILESIPESICTRKGVTTNYFEYTSFNCFLYLIRLRFLIKIPAINLLKSPFNL